MVLVQAVIVGLLIANLVGLYVIFLEVQKGRRVSITLPPDLLIRQDAIAKSHPQARTYYLFDKTGLRHEVSTHAADVPEFYSYGGKSYERLKAHARLIPHLHPATPGPHDFEFAEVVA